MSFLKTIKHKSTNVHVSTCLQSEQVLSISVLESLKNTLIAKMK